MRKGFTLVELSIVLVIIGLLIGGILVAQSMIETAKVNSQIKQLSEFDVSVTNFKTKYVSLPGDSNKYPGSPGDGDGIIESTQSTPGHSAFDLEVAYFWRQLSETGLKTETGSPYSSVATTGVRVRTHVPKAVLGNQFAAIGIRPGEDFTVVTNNYYEIAEYNTTTTDEDSYGYIGDSYATGLTSIQALAIDKKIDDGVSDTGNVIATGSANSCHAFGTYSTSDTTGMCRLLVKLPIDN